MVATMAGQTFLPMFNLHYAMDVEILILEKEGNIQLSPQEVTRTLHFR